ncbi:HAMP domain-containing sensor histidine kinase [Kangiella sp. TOML190]|uniref:sensor histidine kinase n=1 Tax=Kangiella sp. TOML190 TaxID=2931351 RepID=UPI00203BA31D|nr:HAMP domain-containing sensor histidine kinase [Kangiella sp. TOML190]
MPKTLNLTGYLKKSNSKNKLPNHFKELTVGYHRVLIGDSEPLVHVSQRDDEYLYLVFEEGQVSRLAFYFGIAPLAFVLLIIYLPAWISYILSKRAISPVVKLARKMDEAKVSASADLRLDFSEIEQNADAEVASLLGAFNHYADQVQALVTREKNFTRYASHELRTPLAVMKGSVALLEKQQLSEQSQLVLSRMDKVILDMEYLLDALLLLSRSQQISTPKEAIDINQLVDQQLEKARMQFESSTTQVSVEHLAKLQIKIPEQLFISCFGNILNNAINYTPNGKVLIKVKEGSIEVVDTGRGMSQENVEKVFEPFYRVNRENEPIKGFGLGMSIVKTICERMGWTISIDSELAKGTKVTLNFD